MTESLFLKKFQIIVSKFDCVWTLRLISHNLVGQEKSIGDKLERISNWTQNNLFYLFVCYLLYQSWTIINLKFDQKCWIWSLNSNSAEFDGRIWPWNWLVPLNPTYLYYYWIFLRIFIEHVAIQTYQIFHWK